VYERVGDLFRGRFQGPAAAGTVDEAETGVGTKSRTVGRAGWAHSLLFAAELPAFRALLPASLRGEMARFRDDERAKAAEAKAKKRTDREAKAAAEKGGAAGTARVEPRAAQGTGVGAAVDEDASANSGATPPSKNAAIGRKRAASAADGTTPGRKRALK